MLNLQLNININSDIKRGIKMIENIIIVDENGEFDFQAEGYEPEVLGLNPGYLTFIHPLDGGIQNLPCEIHGGCAILFG